MDDVSKWHRQLCTTIGWGKLFEHGRIFPDTLQEVKLPVISTEECRKRTLFLPLYKITDNMFCAGYDRGGRDACLVWILFRMNS
jgi:corin